MNKYVTYGFYGAMIVAIGLLVINSLSMRAQLNHQSKDDYRQLVESNQSLIHQVDSIQKLRTVDSQIIEILESQRDYLQQSLDNIDRKLRAIPTRYEKVHHSVFNGDTSTILHVISNF